MAKKQTKENTSGKGRLRVFFAEFEGNDETIQDGLKAIAAAVNKTFEPKEKVIHYLGSTPVGKEGKEDESADGSDLVIDDLQEEEEATEEKPKRKRARRAPPMTIVKDLNLRPDGKESLRDFYEKKAPKSQYSEITVFLYYLQKILELQEITPHHIFTCYKDVNKKTPKDLPQSIRNTASNKGWVDSSDQKDLKVSNHGENHVEHDLPGSEE